MWHFYEIFLNKIFYEIYLWNLEEALFTRSSLY